MTETLTDLFVRHRSDTVHHRGRIVKAVVRLPVRDGSRISVVRRNATPARPQGLHLAVDDGALAVGATRAPEIVLWSDTSPEAVTLHASGPTRALEVWNTWALGGVENAWLGNAGIVTKATGRGTILRCSDGIGEADFSDLEIEIEITP